MHVVVVVYHPKKWTWVSTTKSKSTALGCVLCTAVSTPKAILTDGCGRDAIWSESHVVGMGRGPVLKHNLKEFIPSLISPNFKLSYWRTWCHMVWDWAVNGRKTASSGGQIFKKILIPKEVFWCNVVSFTLFSLQLHFYFFSQRFFITKIYCCVQGQHIKKDYTGDWERS